MPRSPTARIPLASSSPRVPQLLMRVWDAPTRLFHWAIVVLLITSYVSIKRDNLPLHLLSGYTMAALLLFRLIWGFVGSETSRFRQFLRSPVEGLRHLAEFPRRGPDMEIGHNAAGGWMVLLMLLLLAVQVGLGLFSNADVEGEGPLAHLVSRGVSDMLTQRHGQVFWVVAGVVALHVVAVLAYAVVKRHDLVRPMVTGRKRLPGTMRQPRFASPLLAALILLLCGAAVWAVVRFA